MKKFKDLQVGDTIFIGFEKKTITNIEIMGFNLITIRTKEQSFTVPGNASYKYDKDNVKVVSADKESLVAYFEDQLKHLYTAYNMQKDYYEKMLKKVQELK